MPSKSVSQQKLFQAAEHGADFPMAKKLRKSMSHDQLHDFAVGSESDKPEHVGMKDPPPGGVASFSKAPMPPAPPSPIPGPVPGAPPPGMPQAMNVAPKAPVPMLKGSSPSIMSANTNGLKNAGMNELEATKMAMKGAGRAHPHANLGSWLHPKKG